MTPKFKSRWLMPIVSQMFSQSASNCSLRKRTARGAAVVPEVSFNSEGRSLPVNRSPRHRPCSSPSGSRGRQNLHVSARSGDRRAKLH